MCEAGNPAFRTNLSRFRKNKLLRGIRIFDEKFVAGVASPAFMDDLLEVRTLSHEVSGASIALVQRVMRGEEEIHLTPKEFAVVAEFERAYLTELLARTGGNVTQAARLCGQERSRLNKLVRKHGLNRTDFSRDGQSA